MVDSARSHEASRERPVSAPFSARIACKRSTLDRRLSLRARAHFLERKLRRARVCAGAAHFLAPVGLFARNARARVLSGGSSFSRNSFFSRRGKGENLSRFIYFLESRYFARVGGWQRGGIVLYTARSHSPTRPQPDETHTASILNDHRPLCCRCIQQAT